jgi:hypothetical protein
MRERSEAEGAASGGFVTLFDAGSAVLHRIPIAVETRPTLG